MNKNILIIPAGGSAERLLGLPKFMLPISKTQTLISNHVESAVKAHFDEIHICVRTKYHSLLSEHLKSFSTQVSIHDLEKETQTMCETLLFVLNLLNFDSDDFITVAMPDTIFLGEDMSAIYRSIITDKTPLSLGTFMMRESQQGKLGQVSISDENYILDMIDKNHGCTFPDIWGIAGFSAKFISEIDALDAHIGITFKRLLDSGNLIYAYKSDAKYFDCGTLAEYKECLNNLEFD